MGSAYLSSLYPTTTTGTRNLSMTCLGSSCLFSCSSQPSCSSQSCTSRLLPRLLLHSVDPTRPPEGGGPAPFFCQLVYKFSLIKTEAVSVTIDCARKQRLGTRSYLPFTLPVNVRLPPPTASPSSSLQRRCVPLGSGSLLLRIGFL